MIERRVRLKILMCVVVLMVRMCVSVSRMLSHLTAPVRVRPLLEDDRVAGEVGRWEDWDLGSSLCIHHRGCSLSGLMTNDRVQPVHTND